MARTIRRVRPIFWRILSWFTLDNISKVAAIVTPVIVGLIGWYSTEFWKARDENLATYEKTSATIGKLSVVETAAHRDALFSIIQLGRPDLLKRVSSYVEARINSEMDKEDWQLNFASSLSSDQRKQEQSKLRSKYDTLRSDIFQPLLLGAIAAGDVLVAQSIVEAVPSVLALKRNFRTTEDSYEVWNLLDHAVRAGSESLVNYFLAKGLAANYWTVNLAIDVKDDRILDLVARACPKKTPVAISMWEHAAKFATPGQIRILARNGFRNVGVASVVSIAANSFRHEVLGSLFEAGFSPYAATLEQHTEVMSAAADAFSKTWLDWSIPDPQPFSKTILSLCHRYIDEGVTISKIVPELQLGGDQFAAFHANVARGDVLRRLFEGMDVNAIDCVASFYEFAKLDKQEKTNILMEQAIGEQAAALLLIDRYRFPVDGVLEEAGETIAMRAVARNDIGFLNFLTQQNVDFSKQDKRGNSIWYYAITSPFNNIAERNELTFYLDVRKFRDLTVRLAKIVDVNLKDSEGETALHLAVKDGNAEKIKAIVALKPKLDEVTNGGDTALSLSAAKPSFYMYLYGVGAREPGKIEDCDTAKALLTAIDKAIYIKDSPEPTVRASAPKDCFSAAVPAQ